TSRFLLSDDEGKLISSICVDVFLAVSVLGIFCLFARSLATNRCGRLLQSSIPRLTGRGLPAQRISNWIFAIDYFYHRCLISIPIIDRKESNESQHPNWP